MGKRPEVKVLLSQQRYRNLCRQAGKAAELTWTAKQLLAGVEYLRSAHQQREQGLALAAREIVHLRDEMSSMSECIRRDSKAHDMEVAAARRDLLIAKLALQEATRHAHNRTLDKCPGLKRGASKAWFEKCARVDGNCIVCRARDFMAEATARVKNMKGADNREKGI